MKSLYFHNQELSVIRLNGELWLRGYQIGSALGFARPDAAVPKIFKRHKKEFTNDMTTAIELQTAGGMQLTRIFNTRGAALIAMLAKTERAAEFRRWVLDVLEEEQQKLPSKQMKLLQQELLRLHPRFKQILRYKEMGLNLAEIGKLLNADKSTIRKELRKLEAYGLITPPTNLAQMQQLALPLMGVHHG